ncbi:enoyl-ACP reductase FabV [Anaerosacchariphilus polymeriproducens]|uniref:Trans-2-enoyl-CoA reductase [NADH] n=1 Tax=Anaerosacchariphilus polymeriproducens TaxID=1812858 RepID=A0A371ARS1_9FIRM|nr:enoyl-ACP reductase FabV [Anaerosacchariphilus polymeriproducens]RDU22265.1 trans-2-enoyl-CoA reductase family protein [Anaerosacchariphilus polymeriproducens]
MIIEPKVRGFICTTAHPTGCKENVKRQITYIKNLGEINGPKKVLVIGASTGYGLASRIAATYCLNASTIGVMFEKESNGKRTATPGFYNTMAFEEFADQDGHYAKSINGDAFSQEVKAQVIDLIKNDWGKVDMIIYSLASPRRTTADGTTYQSVLKTTDGEFTNKSWNLKDNTISEATITAATEEEVQGTVKVMGGEDWIDWMKALSDADVLAENATTIAFSYIGPKLTYPVYYNGTIGMAKKHLQESASFINENFKSKGLHAYISVNKALVTQASSAIPIVPLYFAILYKVMKQKNIHEGCIEQIGRLLHEKLFSDSIPVDEEGRIRLDDYEMRPDIQEEVMDIWNKINSENIEELADIEGYWEDFYHMFGFHFENIDYSVDVEL